jgi:hypothetical protein
MMMVLLATVFAACGDDETTVIPLPDPSALFEPPTFCLGGSDSTRTLTVYNRGTGQLDWRPEVVPDGLEGMLPVVLDPVSFLDIDWTWNPPGPYPVLDTVVVRTNDPDNTVIRIPLRRDDPAGAPDLTPPAPPIPFLPEEGSEFAVGDTITIAWSRVDDCSGIRHYRLEVSTTADFRNVVCCRDTIPGTATEVIVEPGDEGTAYWRVYAVDGASLRGLASDPRSWIVR